MKLPQVEEYKPMVCGRCGVGEPIVDACEYASEIHGDESPCEHNCCASCRDACAADI